MGGDCLAFIEIHGPCRIQGGLTVQGSKNAVLPMMAASVLNRGITVLENVPRIQDVFCMMGILDSLGCRCALHGNRLEIDTSKMNGWRIEQKAMGKMRSSIMLLGALLGRFCEAGVYSPGGCMIGKRPIDWHLRALRALGAEIQEPESDGFLHAQTTGLRGAEIIFPFPSVGAVENALFAAVAAVGRTVLRGCAREPEIGQLCHFLNGMGASIRGIGTDALIIEGGLPLHDSRFVIGGDRIVAGTYLLAAASCSGEVIVDDTGAACIDRGAGAYGRFALSGTGTYICTQRTAPAGGIGENRTVSGVSDRSAAVFDGGAVTGRWNQYAAGDGI